MPPFSMLDRLQLFERNLDLRWRWHRSLLNRSIGDRLNQPLPVTMAGSHVHGPGCAAAFPDLPAPVIAISRECEDIRERSCDQHSAQRSTQKYASHLLTLTLSLCKVRNSPLSWFLCLKTSFDHTAQWPFLIEFLTSRKEFYLVRADRVRRLAKIFLPANHANERECEGSMERRFHHGRSRGFRGFLF
jgi:hypothetical protein